MDLQQFVGQFRFQKGLAGYIGVERECFIADQQGVIVPDAHRVLTSLARGILLAGWLHPFKSDSDAFGYELSACQLESRVGPCELKHLRHSLEARQWEQAEILGHFGYCPRHEEVGPPDIPLDIYPDPNGRYQRITEGMPRETLLAACRVTATHVHVGMPDAETALSAYNRVIEYTSELCRAGDDSNGERLAIYRQMAPDCEPRPYASWGGYYEAALARGFAEDPRKCWDLIRISIHGTLEFRMFGATSSTERIVTWARRCHALSTQAVYA